MKQLKMLLLASMIILFTACGGGDSSSIVVPPANSQTIAIDKVKAYANDNTLSAPSIQDYVDAGVVGVTSENIHNVNDVVSILTPDDVDTTAEIQAIVNNLGINIKPVANAGSTQSVEIGTLITLVGYGSNDADSDVLTYSWSLSKPTSSGTTLTNQTAVNPTFIPDVSGSYIATLIVNDGMVNSSPSFVTIKATTAPVAVATADTTSVNIDTTTNTLISLNGSVSSDADNDAITYFWSLTSPIGSSAVLTNITAVSPVFNVDVVGSYVATLTVNDGTVDSTPASVTITATDGQPSTGTVYEDAEDGDTGEWSIYDNDPSGATITNVYDNDKQSRVIQLSGDGQKNGYILGGGWNNEQEKIIKWSMKYDEFFNIYIKVKTLKGTRYFHYTAKDSGSGMQEDGTYIYLGLGSESNNGTWQTITRDLEADLIRYEPDNELLAVNAFMIRGSGLIDNLELIQSSVGLNIDLPVEVSAPGIVFTFDDTHIDSWYGMRDTFKNNGVVASFFCTRWQNLSDSDIVKFNLLEGDGHEIAAHTRDHKGIYDESYDTEINKVNAYLIDQVIPGIEDMQNSGFDPVSFAYPYTQFSPIHHTAIREYLPHIRGFFSNVMGIDDIHNHGIDEIRAELQRIKDNKDIVVFIAHKILPETDPNPDPYRITPEKINQIIDEAKRLGLKFYTIEEAHRIYVNQ